LKSRVWSARPLTLFSPVVEPLSLDEAFIDLTGTERLFGTALEAGRALKRRVFEHTGLVVSVDITPTKMADVSNSAGCAPQDGQATSPAAPAPALKIVVQLKLRNTVTM